MVRTAERGAEEDSHGLGADGRQVPDPPRQNPLEKQRVWLCGVLHRLNLPRLRHRQQRTLRRRSSFGPHLAQAPILQNFVCSGHASL